MFRFLLFLIFIILIQRMLKTAQEQQKEQKEPTKDEIKKYFLTLGFPAPEESQPKPPREKPRQPLIVKKEMKEAGVKIAEPKPKKAKPIIKQEEEAEERLPIFSRDKLEEGIILSEILGPPKAYRICRGGGIGIRAGLKNR